MTTFIKDPNADLDFHQDWTKWLATVEDTIASSEWIVPTGIVEGEGAQASSHTSTVATIWLSGGTDGEDYELTNRITTTGGRVDDRTITISVRER